MTATPRIRTLLAAAIALALLPLAQATDLSTAYTQAVERDPQLKAAAASRDARSVFRTVKVWSCGRYRQKPRLTVAVSAFAWIRRSTITRTTRS